MASKVCILHNVNNLARIPCRFSNTLANKVIEKHRKSKLSVSKEPSWKKPTGIAPENYRLIFPDFLPNPNWHNRDRICELLERRDMLRRRFHIDIPEFYVGSIMAATVADKMTPGKQNRFVGICIKRDKHGLRSTFTIRNIVDKQGVEVTYELYNPLLLKIEVLKLEKRLDEELLYLRDAPQHYSTVPFDFEPVPHQPGAPVPVNTIKVKLGPRPWEFRWEREDVKGIQDLELPQRFYDRAKEVAKPWEKHDLMRQYRSRINDEEADNIMKDVQQGLTEVKKQKAKRDRSLPMGGKM